MPSAREPELYGRLIFFLSGYYIKSLFKNKLICFDTSVICFMYFCTIFIRF